MMTEKQLHRFWKQSFHVLNGLKTTCGQTITIVNPGKYNIDQGQDFRMVKLVLDGQEWIGNVEIHIKTSDWFRHKHQFDANYRNTVLHVVLYHDVDRFTHSPVLALSAYQHLFTYINESNLAVDNTFSVKGNNDQVHECFNLDKKKWVQKRLEQRAAQLLYEIERNGGSWQQAVWIRLARTFGSRVNGSAFETMADSFPFWLLKIYRYDKISLEALFMGQTGLLNSPPFSQKLTQLRQIYQELRDKYSLKPIVHPIYLLRMRPNNFPAVRLSQMAEFIARGHFQSFDNYRGLKHFGKFSGVPDNEGYGKHHLPLLNCAEVRNLIGKQMMNSININVYIPYLYFLGSYAGQPELMQIATGLLRQIPPENNLITRKWNKLGAIIMDAYDSQGILEYDRYLHENECQKRTTS